MKNLAMLLHELKDMSFFNEGDICLIGCSTSGAIGEKTGTVGSMEVAEIIFNALDVVSKETGVIFAFQGYKHINRAMIIERSQLNPLTMKEAFVVPDVYVGGSLAIYVFQRMKDLIMVEHITVPYGIDINQTLIGMHIRHVRVPVRASVKQAGQTIMTVATSRPKKIGGERAKYQ